MAAAAKANKALAKLTPVPLWEERRVVVNVFFCLFCCCSTFCCAWATFVCTGLQLHNDLPAGQAALVSQCCCNALLPTLAHFG